eukprot:5897755-Pyramimonas_sp.AAC.2
MIPFAQEMTRSYRTEQRQAGPPQPTPGGTTFMSRSKQDVDKEKKVKRIISTADYNGEGTIEFYKMGPLLGQGTSSKVTN